jgi:glycosyltransferase involved in cell wall biosynthesis
MRILFRQFLGKKHSWSFVGHGLATALINHNHQVDLYSTDGIKHLPEHLKSHLLGYYDEQTKQKHGKVPTEQYDMQMAYTLPTNFARYLSSGARNRFGIWTYEFDAITNPLPLGFAKHFKSCDLILAPSNYSKQIFIHAGVPDSSMRVIPHGIGGFDTNEIIQLPTTKKCKILANITQLHLRKNISGLLEAYGKAFNKQDDVCLIIKAKPKPVQAAIEIDLNKYLATFNKKFPNHAEVKLYEPYIENIATLYNSIDAVFTMSYCEGFYLPAIEALAAGKINICPRFGGQLDFLNDDNALLVEGKEERADPNAMYWMMNERRTNSIWFRPSIDNAVDKLRYAYENYETLNAKLETNKINIQQQYSWMNISQRILDLCV